MQIACEVLNVSSKYQLTDSNFCFGSNSKELVKIFPTASPYRPWSLAAEGGGSDDKPSRLVDQRCLQFSMNLPEGRDG
jgi:hypothetical protein